MKECKYRLPCNWCDRLNKYCDMVESVKLELECDHDWVFEKQSTSTKGTDIYYKCRKCNATFVKCWDGITYESGDWQP